MMFKLDTGLSLLLIRNLRSGKGFEQIYLALYSKAYAGDCFTYIKDRHTPKKLMRD